MEGKCAIRIEPQMEERASIFGSWISVHTMKSISCRRRVMADARETGIKHTASLRAGEVTESVSVTILPLEPCLRQKELRKHGPNKLGGISKPEDHLLVVNNTY